MNVVLALFLAAALDTPRLQAMEDAIRAGEFKKITSILVSRARQIVYEKYFDGDETFLIDGDVPQRRLIKITKFAVKNLCAPLGIDHVEWGASPLDQTMTGGGTCFRRRDLLK